MPSNPIAINVYGTKMYFQKNVFASITGNTLRVNSTIVLRINLKI